MHVKIIPKTSQIRYNRHMKTQKTGNHSFFSRNTLRHQMIVIFAVTILAPMLVFGVFLSVYGYRNIETNYENLCESKAGQVKTILLISTLSVDQIKNQLCESSAFLKLLQTDYDTYPQAKSEFSSFNSLSSIRDSSPEISDIRVYVNQAQLMSTVNIREFYPINDEVRQSGWYKKAATTQRAFLESSQRTDDYGMSYCELRYYSRIPLPLRHSYAILCVTFSTNYLRSLIEKDGYRLSLSVNGDPMFLCSDRTKGGEPFPLDIPYMDVNYRDTGNGEIFGDKTIYTVSSIKPYKTDDALHVLVDSSRFYHQLQSMMWTSATLGAAIVLISAFIVLTYSRYFYSRIKTLRLAISKLSKDDYEIVNQVRGNDELTEAFRELKQMAERLKAREADYYRSRIEEQELIASQQQMELKLLSGQINPHFLYNTLEMIRMQALINKDRKVSEAIKVLGKCMRYVLSNTLSASTTLDKELDYLYDYLFIMNMRFTERLGYEVRVDEDIDRASVLILPLLIQPLVENSIIHGIEESENGGTVIIELEKKGNILQIRVADTGVGMDRKTLESKRKSIITPPSPDAKHGVAMYNIDHRIHIYYGREYGLKLYSHTGQGTIAMIRIPFVEKEENKE